MGTVPFPQDFPYSFPKKSKRNALIRTLYEEHCTLQLCHHLLLTNSTNLLSRFLHLFISLVTPINPLRSLFLQIMMHRLILGTLCISRALFHPSGGVADVLKCAGPSPDWLDLRLQ